MQLQNFENFVQLLALIDLCSNNNFSVGLVVQADKQMGKKNFY